MPQMQLEEEEEKKKKKGFAQHLTRAKYPTGDVIYLKALTVEKPREIQDFFKLLPKLSKILFPV